VTFMLKLDTCKGLIKAHLRTKFSWILIKTYGFMIDFLCKKVEGLQDKQLK